MRRLAVATLSLAALAAVACAKTETKTTDSSAAAAAAAPPPPPAVTPADWAGTWSMTTKNQAGDSVLVSSELTATADTTGWMVKLPNRPAMPAHIMAMGGDSVVADAGPYESVLRKGVKVTTHSVYHLQNGMIKGTTTAHYTVKTADSVRTLMTEGTKKAPADTTKKMDSTAKKKG
jgi:hypothetical protein